MATFSTVAPGQYFQSLLTGHVYRVYMRDPHDPAKTVLLTSDAKISIRTAALLDTDRYIELGRRDCCDQHRTTLVALRQRGCEALAQQMGRPS